MRINWRHPQLQVTLLSTVLTLVSVFALTCHGAVFADSSCAIQKMDDTNESSLTYLRINGRKIAIIGWSRPNALMSLDKFTKDLFAQANDAAKKNNCARTKSAFQELLAARTENISSSRDLASRFEKVNQEFAADVMGLEFSSDNWSKTKSTLDSMNETLSFAAKKCPAEVEPLVSNLSALYPGPQYNIQQATPRLKVRPLEDERLRMQSLSLAREIGDLEVLDIMQLNRQARAMYSAVLDKFSAGTVVQEDERAKILAAQGDNAAGILLAKYIDTFNRLASVTNYRNSRIADGILESSGNYVMAVSRSRADDLASQLLGKCQLLNVARTFPGADGAAKVSDTISR